MTRKKPFSSKQRKAQLQEKRAVKRGDISPPPVSRNPKTNRRPLTARSSASTPAIESSKRLQSAFIKLTPDYLTKSKLVASTFPLSRPLSPAVAVFSLPGRTKSDDAALTCPKRPRWRYEMSKKEVEKNEEGLFDKWLDQTDDVLQGWVDEGVPEAMPGPEKEVEADLVMPRAPTHYERNLEVWRQLYVDTLSHHILKANGHQMASHRNFSNSSYPPGFSMPPTALSTFSCIIPCNVSESQNNPCPYKSRYLWC